ncbi:LOW QUALITY PROTEIN: mesoderm induction early response protein 2 [Gymnodraco acuticeps]|uniref:LOW QUALITY PROTEIN: mesoderm induction early response protein 2 n=1 Tax=Gymnodraco acuticeps TaxID=8218 RepID=A0A6P8V2S4_GYMAC|nr:LOW QUALITY PROTEIN: mesoderm induction early response protein 2 [Gymnodraco acuticeps]
MKMAAQSHTVRSSSAIYTKAGELPLVELLALYGYTMSDPEKETCHMTASLPGMTLDKDQITEDLFPGEEEESSAGYLTPSVTSNTSDLLRRLQGGDKDTLVSSSEEDLDDAFIPSKEEHKEIMVGSMYQAKILPLSSCTNQERACSGEDQLLWKPGVLPEQEVEEFLLNAQRPFNQEGAACTQTQGHTVRDNQQALYELVKCNFNAEEALRRVSFNVKVFSEELCAWSEEECRSFEHGYRVYGKNFNLIQGNKVRTRSVGECVQYYYMWKKSERHEYFTQQTTRLSRKKFSLQSGSIEDGEQDGEGGEVEGSNSSSGLSSRGSTRQLESPVPPQSSLELDKQDGALVSDLCGDGCPQFGCPFSLLPLDDLRDPGSGSCCPSAQLQPPPQWSPPSRHEDPRLSGPCFYQLHMCGGPFVSEDGDAAGGGTPPPHGLQVEFSLPSASPPSSSVLPSHFQTLGALLHSSPVQHPPPLSHSDGTWGN